MPSDNTGARSFPGPLHTRCSQRRKNDDFGPYRIFNQNSRPHNATQIPYLPIHTKQERVPTFLEQDLEVKVKADSTHGTLSKLLDPIRRLITQIFDGNPFLGIMQKTGITTEERRVPTYNSTYASLLIEMEESIEGERWGEREWFLFSEEMTTETTKRLEIRMATHVWTQELKELKEWGELDEFKAWDEWEALEELMDFEDSESSLHAEKGKKARKSCQQILHVKSNVDAEQRSITFTPFIIPPRSNENNTPKAASRSCSSISHLPRDRESSAEWKKGAGRNKSWKRPSHKQLVKLRSTFAISEPSDRFLPISQLKAKKRASPGSSRATDCVCERHSNPLPRRKPSRRVDINGCMKSQRSRENLTDMLDYYGYIVQELSDLPTRSLCIYYTPAMLRGKKPGESNIPLIGPHSLKKEHPESLFISVQQFPMFVPMKSLFEHWSLLGYLWDHEKSSDAAKDQLQSNDKVRIDDNTPSASDELQTRTRPEHYRSLSKAGKRRVRAAQSKPKNQIPQKPVAKTPNRRNETPKWLKVLRKKRFKRGEDVYNTCHTCWQIYTCGHRYQTLCWECDQSWDSGQPIQCPLWGIRMKENIELEPFILHRPTSCTICPDVDIQDAEERVRARYYRHIDRPFVGWVIVPPSSRHNLVQELGRDYERWWKRWIDEVEGEEWDLRFQEYGYEDREQLEVEFRAFRRGL